MSYGVPSTTFLRISVAVNVLGKVVTINLVQTVLTRIPSFPNSFDMPWYK